MTQRPLLILGAPGPPAGRRKKPPARGQVNTPPLARQVVRLGPKFEALVKAMEAQTLSLAPDADGLVPEQVIVLETVGGLQNFVSAARAAGLEWLGEVDEDGLAPDADFFIESKDGKRSDKPLRGRLFLAISDQQALKNLVSAWSLWTQGKTLPKDLAGWKPIFTNLRDVRQWGLKDRLLETGVVEDWRERIKEGAEDVPCEIELWFRRTPEFRGQVSARVRALVTGCAGEVVHEAAIEEIGYHGILARIPIEHVQALLGGALPDTALLKCEQIQFFHSAGQMAAVIDTAHADEAPTDAPAHPVLGDPVVALLDGVPVQDHPWLQGALNVDDPDEFESDYQAGERVHGTAMASLIVNGDLGSNGKRISRTLYVRPIMSPDERDWRNPRPETMPADRLAVDVLYRAVVRMFQGEEDAPPVAPSVRVINLSVGCTDRLFDTAMSPMARLIDWLSWQYEVLFLVSAGNHLGELEFPMSSDDFSALAPEELSARIIEIVARDTRNRRLRVPAESVNALTIGSANSDASHGAGVAGALTPFADGSLPSVFSAHGMGFRRAIKPDVLFPGGRSALIRGPLADPVKLQIYCQGRHPGLKVAAPAISAAQPDRVCHIRGTSAATALASHTACHLFDVLLDLKKQPNAWRLSEIPEALWLKALLVHGASWGGARAEMEKVLKNSDNGRRFREYLTRFLGYGAVEPSRVMECTALRVTGLGCGNLAKGTSHVHRMPLPPSLSAKAIHRSLRLTLAWFSPVNASHRGWRRADLWFHPPEEVLAVKRTEADWRAVQRGTVQHEVLQGTSAAAYLSGASLEVQVNCRADAGALDVEVPYAFCATLEADEAVGVDIYSEVRLLVHPAQAKITP